MSILKTICLVLFVFIGLVAKAHEAQPAYLEIKQTANNLHITWKNLVQDMQASNLVPQVGNNWLKAAPTKQYTQPYYEVKEWDITTKDALNGQVITFDNMEQSFVKVLVRINFSDGANATYIITSSQPAITISGRGQAGASAYLKLGVEHIWTGIDHLLFVFGLLLLVKGKWRLLKTITAFTLAHSVTLALAALGLVHIPYAPVEAVIALSILFLAVEIIHHYNGKDSLTYKYPWVVAFSFGLLHGFGFAGALSEVGLPQGAIPLALLLFNVGIELGQIAFVLVILLLGYLLHTFIKKLPTWALRLPAYVIGSVAGYWFIERTVAIF